MKKLILLSAAAFLALPAAAAPAAGIPEVPEVPEVNCGIVSCTYPVEKRLDTVKECVDGAVVAVGQMLEGITPEMQDCRLG